MYDPSCKYNLAFTAHLPSPYYQRYVQATFKKVLSRTKGVSAHARHVIMHSIPVIIHDIKAAKREWNEYWNTPKVIIRAKYDIPLLCLDKGPWRPE